MTSAVRHVVMFTFREGTTSEDVERIKRSLAELSRLIEPCRAFEFGVDLSLVDGNADLVVVGEFDSEDDYLSYARHPAHVSFVNDVLQPHLAQRAAVQYRREHDGER